MKAVVFEKPFTVAVAQVPAPREQDLQEDEAIVQVELAGLCGSDLHVYRGAESVPRGTIQGHEFIGRVVSSRSRFVSVGTLVVAPFSTSCGSCVGCLRGLSSRCSAAKLFGSPALAGAQAEFVKVPHASNSLVALNPALDVSRESLLLCADILPTGFFAALQAVTHPNLAGVLRGIPQTDLVWSAVSPLPSTIPLPALTAPTLTFAIVGLGPVGQCALVSLLDILMRPTQAPLRLPDDSLLSRSIRLLLVDGVPQRRLTAVNMINTIQKTSGGFKNLVVESLDLDQAQKWTQSRNLDECADAVLEAVGANSSLSLAYHLIRPFGVISSVGVHTSPTFPLTGDDLYNKNASLAFGRCPVRALLPLALGTLERRQDVLGKVGGGGLIDRVVHVNQAVEMYKLFEERKVGKVLFRFDEGKSAAKL
ncbi:hypothetical protein HDU99_010185 [Rhizoclosmatium hyalinum]|nr:hypothetical protein HDU99_010185 [Rhizoclosmatium hyalinum]